jgi:transcriptional regulator GlxA family with amidase domain
MAGVRDEPDTDERGLAVWQLDLAVRLLLDDLAVDFSVAELANCCGLSRSYFTRAFKTSMGLPPHRWLMCYRVARAGEMLEQSSAGVVQIALNCGFADQSHFTRVFHAIAGASPAAWRRQRKAGVAQPVSL